METSEGRAALHGGARGVNTPPGEKNPARGGGRSALEVSGDRQDKGAGIVRDGVGKRRTPWQSHVAHQDALRSVQQIGR